MRRVIIESPFKGDVEINKAYARAAMRDSLLRGEAPYASHLIYTQPGVFNDNDPVERQRGIDAGIAWGAVADAVAVYTDLGMSEGMKYGVKKHKEAGRTVEFRSLPNWSRR